MLGKPLSSFVSKKRLATLALLTACIANPFSSAEAVDWLGGTGNWTDSLFWDTGFVPGPGEDVWINAAAGSEINFDAASATIAELRLGNGNDNQVFNIPSGTLTITADSTGGDDSWSGRWSSNTTTRISGTGSIDITNVGQQEIPYYIAGNQGPGGDQNFLQDAQFIVEENGSFYVRDGGAALDENGNPSAGGVSVAQWREARATITVRDNGLIDIARDLSSNSGGLTLNQEGGTINVGGNFFLDRFDAIDGQGVAAEGFGTVSDGQFNVGWNFHVVQNGKGIFTVTDNGELDVDNILKVNDVFPDAASADGDATLRIEEGGLATTRFLEVPTSSQLVNDVAVLDISGGLLVIEDSAVETTSDIEGNSSSNPIPDDVAGWISSGFITGSLGTTNRVPSVAIPSISTQGDIAWGRASAGDGGALYIWTQAVVALAGDFNADGTVDAADYTVWRDNLGAPTEDSLNGNGDGNGTVDAGDYTTWVTNFGNSSSSSAAAAVPEPSTLLSAALLIALTAAPKRER